MPARARVSRAPRTRALGARRERPPPGGVGVEGVGFVPQRGLDRRQHGAHRLQGRATSVSAARPAPRSGAPHDFPRQRARDRRLGRRRRGGQHRDEHRRARDCRAPPRRAPGAPRSTGSSATIDAVVASKSRMCMHTVTPVPSAATSAGAATTGPSLSGRTPRTGAVIAQMGHRGARRGRRAGERARRREGRRGCGCHEGPAGGQAPVGEPGRCGRVAPGVEVGPRRHVRRRPRPVAPQRQAVGDGAAALDGAGRPRPSRGLEHQGRGGVGDRNEDQ